MTDPFSVAAGTAGLISLGMKTTHTFIQFYSSYKHRDSNIARTTEKLESLLGTLQVLESALQHRSDDPLIHQIDSSVQHSREIIQELQQECTKLTTSSSNFTWSATKVVGRRAAYPFRASTLNKLDEDVGEMRSHLSFALDVLQLQDSRTLQDDLAEAKSVIDLIRTTQISVAIRDWLRAPDVSVNHNAARTKRHPGTGMWFIQGPHFSRWITQPSAFLWLHGFAGCGKTVLCSTAVEHAYRQRGRESHVGVACFYFTFNDESKRDESAMLRALLLQLADQLADGHSVLQHLHDVYRSGPPPPLTLRDYLRQLIKKFDHVYLLIDALDESPRYDQRDSVLESIAALREGVPTGLHLLVTSRNESDIRDALGTAIEEVKLKTAGIDDDIGKFVAQKLETDPILRKKWHGDREKIREALTQRAQGV
jgi:hypothetical protein